MMRISVPEFGRIPRADIGKKLLRRLQAFDEGYARTTGSCVFDWDRLSDVRTQSYVGVVQIPGLVVEILPKIDTARQQDDRPFLKGDARQAGAQRNLLYMLSLTKKIPIHERDIAGLRLQAMPLFEALIRIFVERVHEENRKGLDRAYIHREQNERVLKGKLLLTPHLRTNAAHRERFFVGYDEFIPDTGINRVLKAACHRLLLLSGSNRNQQRLREVLLHFVDVTDLAIRPHHFGEIHYNRNTERFRPLVDFSRIVLTGATPAPALGKMQTFSLLFPMETLFEEFVARFIQRYCSAFGLRPQMVHAQAARRQKWLLKDATGAPKFGLRPDVVIDRLAGGVSVILDTKWKRLKTDREDAKNGIAQSDLYQLYAYAQRYDCANNVLLFPKVEGVSPKTYRLQGAEDKQLRVEFLDLSRDLQRQRHALIEDFRRILFGGDAAAQEVV